MDYSITQTTLDDVFVRFARLQRETNGDNCDEGPLRLLNNNLTICLVILMGIIGFEFEDLPMHLRTGNHDATTDEQAVSINSTV